MTKHSEHGEEVSGAGLFEDLASPSEAERARALARAGKRLQGQPRVLEPNRAQVELRASDLESLLGEDHRARLVWGYVERQNLSGLFDAIKARGAVPGRRAIDPRILFALWLYATLDGVGSGLCAWLVLVGTKPELSSIAVSYRATDWTKTARVSNASHSA